MNENSKTSQSFRIIRTPVVTIQGNLSRHIGSMRAVMLDKAIFNGASSADAAKTFQESFDRVFGKSLRDLQPEEGRFEAKSKYGSHNTDS